MKPSYLIDGYNLMHAMGVLQRREGARGLERARASLLQILAEAFGEDSSRLTVVFDSSRARTKDQAGEQHRGIEVLFSSGGQEADDLIEDLLAKEREPRKLVVVSSDHRLQQAARRGRASYLDCVAFLDLLQQRRHPTTEQTASPPAPEKEERLSAEETKRWVEEFKEAQDELDRDKRVRRLRP